MCLASVFVPDIEFILKWLFAHMVHHNTAGYLALLKEVRLRCESARLDVH